MFTSESAPISRVGTVGAQIDAITKKIENLKRQRLDIKIGDTKGLKAIDSQIAELEQRKASLEYSSPKKSKKKKKKKKKHKKNPDDVASHKFSHDRQRDLEEAKRSYQEDLNALNEALAQKRLTQEQYNAYVSALNIEHQNNLLAIEIDRLDGSHANIFKTAQMIEIAFSKGHEKADALDARNVQSETFQLFVMQKIHIFRTDFGEIIDALYLHRLCFDPMPCFPIAAVCRDFSNINFRIKIRCKGIAVVSCVAV